MLHSQKEGGGPSCWEHITKAAASAKEEKRKGKAADMHAGSPSALSSRKLSPGSAVTVKSVLLSVLSLAPASLPSCPGGYSDV